MKERVRDVQKHLQNSGLDGWLLYDFHQRNELAYSFLKIPKETFVTRRFFYWIPAEGEPVQIVHVIEPHVLEHLPGAKLTYLKWQTLEACVNQVLNGAKRVAMEHSPHNAIPYVAKVEAGVIDLVRSFGVEVVSSASFLQYYTCVCTEEQKESHFAAAQMLDKAAAIAWNWIAEALKSGRRVTEYEVSQFIIKTCDGEGFMLEHPPICAVNAHSADPHYEPKKEGSSVIKKEDFILIDLWCKRKKPNSIYGDITRVGFAGKTPTPRHREIFNIVRKAQKAATDLCIEKYGRKEMLKGAAVDRACRQVIEEAGFGDFFTHRTGHNIYTETHGPGANNDSLETLDERCHIPQTCCSIEPGIYLPGEFGVRLEYDLFFDLAGKVHITGGMQEEITTLF